MTTTPIHNLTDVWADGATTFNAIKMNVTDTASAAASKLFLLQVGGVDKVAIDKDGAFQDSLFALADNADRTKKVQFQVSGVTTGTTRTLTVPDFDGTIATLAGTETFTNKTIDSANNTLTLDLSEGTLTGTLAEFNTALSDENFVSIGGAETLTNKTLTSPTINGGTISGITDLAVADGGTGASTAAGARANLNLHLATVAALTALLKAGLADGETAFVKQYSTVAGRGGGEFRWDAASTDTANDVTVFESDEGGAGRWFRIHNGSVDLYDAGAVPGGVDYTTRFQAAIDAMEDVGTVEIPWSLAGFTLGAVTIGGKIRIQGKGEKAKIAIASGVATWCAISSGQVAFDNLEFTSGANCTNALFLLDTSAAAYEQIHFTNIRTNGLAAAFSKDDATDARRLDEIYHDNITLVAHAGPGFVYRDLFAFGFFRQCFVDYVGSASPNHIGFDFDGDIGADGGTNTVEGLVFNKCEVTGTAGSSAQKGFSVKNASAVFFLRCFADTCGGEGFLIESVANLHMNDVVQSLCDAPLTLRAVTTPQVSKVRVIGRKGIGGATASVDGIRIYDGTVGGNFSNVRVESATGNGLHYDHSGAAANTRNIFMGVSAVSCTGYGIRSTGTTGTPSGTFVGAYFDGNTAGDYLLANQNAGSGFERISDYIRNSGAYDICGGDGIIGGDLSVSGDLSGSTASFSGDFDVDTDTFFVDVSEDRVGVNTTSPGFSNHVVGLEAAGAPSLATPAGQFYLEAGAGGVGQGYGLLAGVSTATGDTWMQAQRTAGGTGAFNVSFQSAGGNFYIGKQTGAHKLDIDGDVNVDSGHVFRVAGTQVVGTQGAAVADASGGATVDAEARTAINALLARLRTHGLIAT